MDVGVFLVCNSQTRLMMSLCPLPWLRKNARKLPSTLLDKTREWESVHERSREREREREKEKSFSINFLFNVSAPAPLWEREDASSRHKFAIIQPHGDSHLQDPELVVGKTPRWINSAESERVKEVERYLSPYIECALVWIKRLQEQRFFFFVPSCQVLGRSKILFDCLFFNLYPFISKSCYMETDVL